MTSSRAYTNNAIRRAMRSLLIIEGSASADGGELSMPQLKQMIQAQCKEANKALLAAMRGHEYDDQAHFNAASIQKMARGKLQRSQALANVRAAIVIQKYARGFIARQRATPPELSAGGAAAVEFVGQLTQFLDDLDDEYDIGTQEGGLSVVLDMQPPNAKRHKA